MTSFKAMTDTTKGLTKVMGITSDDRYISYLPIAHGMERWLGMVRLQLSFSSFDKLLHFRLFFPQTNFFNIVLFTQCAVCSILHGNASLVCRGSYHLCCWPQPLRAHSVFVGTSVSDVCIYCLSLNSLSIAWMFISGPSKTHIIRIIQSLDQIPSGSLYKASWVEDQHFAQYSHY